MDPTNWLYTSQTTQGNEFNPCSNNAPIILSMEDEVSVSFPESKTMFNDIKLQSIYILYIQVLSYQQKRG